MKTWRLYDSLNRVPVKISGHTLEEAVNSNAKDLAHFRNPSDNHVGDITSVSVDYSEGIMGGTGGAVARIFYKAAYPRVGSPYDIDEYNDIWIYADENLEPPHSGNVSQIKEYRNKAGLSQAEMASVFEIPKRTLESWEMGERVPPRYVEKLIIEKLKEMEKK